MLLQSNAISPRLGTNLESALHFYPELPIDNKPSLFQEIVWHRTRDKQITEPMMTQLMSLSQNVFTHSGLKNILKI